MRRASCAHVFVLTSIRLFNSAQRVLSHQVFFFLKGHEAVDLPSCVYTCTVRDVVCCGDFWRPFKRGSSHVAHGVSARHLTGGNRAIAVGPGPPGPRSTSPSIKVVAHTKLRIQKTKQLYELQKAFAVQGETKTHDTRTHT